MASSHRSSSPAKSIRFFKIVLSDVGSHSKLMIPTKLARILGNNLTNCIYLNAPNGSVWSIGLERHKDDVWMQNGWPEFAEFYSICCGYLLVFEFQGYSKFKVHIFDQSAMEIDYPTTSSGANLDFVKSTQSKKREICTGLEVRPRKKTRASSSCVEPCYTGRKLRNDKGIFSANVKGESACNEEKNSALLLAKGFKSKNPFFMLSVKPYHVKLSHGYGNSSVHITKTFKEAYTKWMNNVEVILEVRGRTWPVYSRLNLKWDRCTFSRGWFGFARDNSLNVGDICVFELINPSRKLFKVFIFRATDEAYNDTTSSDVIRPGVKTRAGSTCIEPCHNGQKLQHEKAYVYGESACNVDKNSAIASAKDFKSKNPSFIVSVKPSHVDGRARVHITKAFEEAYMKWMKNVKVILKVGEKSWPVNCHFSPNCKRCAFGLGWTGFARDNSLCVGDDCVFELINPSKRLFTVFLFRSSNMRS